MKVNAVYKCRAVLNQTAVTEAPQWLKRNLKIKISANQKHEQLHLEAEIQDLTAIIQVNKKGLLELVAFDLQHRTLGFFNAMSIKSYGHFSDRFFWVKRI